MPTDLDYCQTLHIMDSTGTSVIVNKKCANRTECQPSTVGCLSIDRQTVRNIFNIQSSKHFLKFDKIDEKKVFFT